MERGSTIRGGRAGGLKPASIKDQLRWRTDDGIRRGDDMPSFKGIWLPNLKEVLQTTEIPFWKCKAGDHTLDIIPYISGDNDPIKPGEWTYLLDIWVHTNIGVNKSQYICMNLSYGKPCVICEYRDELRGQESADEQTIKDLMAKHRGIYNIICYDNAQEEAKGIQIWDVAFFFMEKHLRSLAKAPKTRGGVATGGHVYFSDPDEGKAIFFTRKGEKDNTSFFGHRFLDREYQIEPALLEKAYILDQYLHIPDQEEIRADFFGRESVQEQIPEEITAEQEEDMKVGENPTPRPSRSIPSSTNAPQCPVEGGIFGQSCETLAECGNCSIWKVCAAEADRLEVSADRKPTPLPMKPAPTLKERMLEKKSTPSATPPPSSRRGVVGRMK